MLKKWPSNFKKADIAVIAVVLIAAFIGLAVLARGNGADGAGLCAEIYVDGALTQVIDLSNGEQHIRLGFDTGYNLLFTGPQGILMLEADCPNKDCVHSGLKSRPGSFIACLPHRLLVRLTGAKDGAFDAIAH
ncbi:MAG: NusG domain II-containing protein [Clostridiales bacterium]|nr:NusG domain II-containing protein [Clostridiales bacterium]